MGKKALIFLPLLVLTIGGSITYRELRVSDTEPARMASEYVVELHEDGFHPEKITIQKGAVVTFITTRNKDFWPASNLHPTHIIYREFDPKKAIAPDNSWNFTFNKTGEWRYHDHTAPYFTGTIIVEEHDHDKTHVHHLDTAENIDCSKLDALNDYEKEKCWDKVLGEALREKGVEGSLEAFRQLYTTQPNFAQSGCHWYAHRIGEEAYGYYRGGEDLDLPQEVSYCGYGFVHGFLEHGFREERNPTEAKRLCNYLDTQLSDILPRIRLNCFHAIGHGFIDDPPNPRIWGNSQAIIGPALKICESVSDVPIEVKECFDGAYNTLVIFMQTNQYGLSFDKKDPLGFCHNEPDRYQLSCYYEFAQVLDSAGDRDLATIAKFVEGIPEDTLAGMIINTAAAGVVQGDITNDDFTNYILECRKTGERLRLQCIRGVVGGLLAHGEPGKEYIKALKLCDAGLLLEDEHKACFHNTLNGIKTIYPREKVEQICKTIDEKYQSYCTYQ
ncbi:MAG: cupredoxin domain-containing protein [Patescibacteria group bacterium]|nr:cupredoxin domain-containing protein [Patescibacteria group bacterium]